MEILLWITSLVSLLGVVLNIYKLRVCFVLWFATNAVWAVVDYDHGITSQALIQAVYCVLSVWGIVKWTSERQSRQ